MCQPNIFFWNDALPRASPDLLPRCPIISFLYICEGDSDVLLAFPICFYCLPNTEDHIYGASSGHESQLAFTNLRSLLQWPVANFEFLVIEYRYRRHCRQFRTFSTKTNRTNEH